MPTRRAYQTWSALEGYDLARDWQSHEVHPVLPDEPGTIHAYRAAVTGSRDPEFFDRQGPWALCGEHVKVRLAVALRADQEDVCERCAELVPKGVLGNADPRTWPPSGCQAIVLPALEGVPQGVDCARRERHDGPHRSAGGHSWLAGPEDFTPARWSAS